MTFLIDHWLDITTTILGLAYILLEYRASVWMWVVGAAMQLLGIILYYQKELYADCGMEFYYLAVTAYGFWKWNKKNSENSEFAKNSLNTENTLPIRHFPKCQVANWVAATLVIWLAIYQFLIHFTNSTVPVADAFTTALSIVGIWALAHKYLEQWLVWIVVDVVTCWLYWQKDIPFKASLYALYVVIAVLGFLRWWRQMRAERL